MVAIFKMGSIQENESKNSTFILISNLTNAIIYNSIPQAWPRGQELRTLPNNASPLTAECRSKDRFHLLERSGRVDIEGRRYVLLELVLLN